MINIGGILKKATIFRQEKDSLHCSCCLDIIKISNNKNAISIKWGTLSVAKTKPLINQTIL